MNAVWSRWQADAYIFTENYGNEIKVAAKMSEALVGNQQVLLYCTNNGNLPKFLQIFISLQQLRVYFTPDKAK
jgi:hypothetical protein